MVNSGGTERTRTVIGLIDNQVPHLSATVPCEKLAARAGFEPDNLLIESGWLKPLVDNP